MVRVMDKVLKEIGHIASGYNVNKVVLFGSRARGDNTPKSDYDIAVFANNMDISEQSAFLSDIEAIETLNKIEVVFIRDRHIGTELYINIQKDGVDIMNKVQIKLNNYKNALARLHEALEESKETSSLTVRDGVIQRFEFTTELAWKTMREYLLTEGVTDIHSPKSVMREAYHNNLITDDEGWLSILRDTNSTSHIYDEEDAADIYNRIISEHIKLFDAFEKIFLDNC